MTQALNPRQIAILNQIRQAGRVFVDDLSEAFATTPQTIRRDLQILAESGEVMRFEAPLPPDMEALVEALRAAEC